MMRILKLLIIIPLLGYGGIKGYLWYEVDTMMDEMSQTLSPFVNLSYGSVTSSMTGSVGVQEVVIQPKMTNDEFTIQEVTVSAPSMYDILFMGSKYASKEFPETMGIDIKKIGIDLDSKIFSMIENMQAQMAARGAPQSKTTLIERLDSMGCADIIKFRPRDYSAMGYNPIKVDLAMNVNYKKTTRDMTIDMRVKDRDYYDVSFDFKFPFDPEQLKGGLKSGVKLSDEQAFSKVNMNYSDNGYHRLRNRYCAKLNGSTEEEFVDENISQLLAHMGAEFPHSVVDAYRDFLLNGGTFQVSMDPVESVLLSNVGLYKNSDVMDILGMEITINGVTLTNDKITWDGVSPEDRDKAGSEVQEETAMVESDSEPPEVKPVDPPSVQVEVKPAVQEPVKAPVKAPEKVETKTAKAKYKTVEIDDLPKYIGKFVEVDTSSGKQRAGRLVSVDNSRVRIRMKLGGGEFSFPVKVAEIVSIKVYTQ